MLKHIQNPAERALYTANALGIHLNKDYDSYGEAPLIRGMAGDEIVIYTSKSNIVTFLSGLHHNVSRILAMLSAECIDYQDRGKALKSISETVAAKKNSEIYNKWIYGNQSLIRILK